MSGFWLRCDACNKELKVESDREMQLAVRFKPALVHLALGRLEQSELLHRCSSCGWVNVFIQASAATSDPLTPNWRDAIILK